MLVVGGPKWTAFEPSRGVCPPPRRVPKATLVQVLPHTIYVVDGIMRRPALLPVGCVVACGNRRAPADTTLCTCSPSSMGPLDLEAPLMNGGDGSLADRPRRGRGGSFSILKVARQYARYGTQLAKPEHTTFVAALSTWRLIVPVSPSSNESPSRIAHELPPSSFRARERELTRERRTPPPQRRSPAASGAWSGSSAVTPLGE